MMNVRFFLFGMYLLVSSNVWLCQECYDAKCELMQNLTRSYWKDTLPDCPGSSLPVDVGMQLWLRQIVDLDEPKQIFTTNVWVRFGWNDCRLRWNPADYNGIDLLYFPYGSIWTPDVTLYDDSSFGSNIAMSERKFYRLEVYSNGRVKQKFPSLLKCVCGIDTTYFPFDKQTCPLKFGPWAYDYPTVNMTTDKDGVTSAYVENAEWVLNAMQSESTIKIYSNQSFTQVIYHVEIERRPAFFMLTLFFPCFLICTMALLGFFLPPSSAQKVGIQLTLLLSLTVFEFLTLSIVPPNSKPLPLMCVYFALVMGLAGLSCVLSVVVMKIHMKGEQGWKVSPLVRAILVVKLGRLLRVKRPHLLREHAQDDLSKNKMGVSSKKRSSTNSNGRPSMVSGRHMTALSASLEESSSSDLSAVINSFESVAEKLSKLIDHMEEKNIHHESAEFQDWVTIASILDRLFLILYILLSIIVFLVFISKLLS